LGIKVLKYKEGNPIWKAVVLGTKRERKKKGTKCHSQGPLCNRSANLHHQWKHKLEAGGKIRVAGPWNSERKRARGMRREKV